MNVLILTPDAVGSTFLQRTLTMYMQLYEFDRPVINLHEFSNGLTKYFSPEFNQEILSRDNSAKGYHQSLPEVVDLLDSVNHYKTGRIAHYHIKNRKDPTNDQLHFYNYLNENFFIISCRRKNVFEYALSWAINKVTNKLNVYSTVEKIDAFLHHYQNKIVIDQQSLLKSLDRYKDYLAWCEHFQIANYFEYEQHVPDIENFIFELPIFKSKEKLKTFDQVFDITFNDWNKIRYLSGDIGSLAMHEDFNKFAESLMATNHSDSTVFLPWESEAIAAYNNLADKTWPQVQKPSDLSNLPNTIKQEIKDVHKINFEAMESGYPLACFASTTNLNFMKENAQEYMNALGAMHDMMQVGILPGPVPMKKQTLSEKKHIVKNFEQCVDTYNQWQNQNASIAEPFDSVHLHNQLELENNFWKTHNNRLEKL